MANVLFFNADVGATLEFTILEADGTPYDITGDTITLLVEGVDEFSCTVIDGPTGRADYVVAANDFQPGTYRAQIKTVVGAVTLHSPHFHIQVGQVVDTTPVVTASVAPAEGAIPFGAVGGGAFTTDATNLFWDDTNNNLRLFGGTVGTGGVKVLVMGIGTAPSTSPADTVQLYAEDTDGAGTAGLGIRTESGHVHSIGRLVELQAGSQTSRAATAGGTLSSQFGTVGTGANTTETDLFTYTIPANTLAVNGQRVHIKAWGSFAANGNTKTVNFRVGATTIITQLSGAFSGTGWVVDGTLIRTGAAAQDTFALSITGLNTQYHASYTSTTESLTSSLIVKVTGTNGTAAANDIVGKGFIVEWMPE